MSCTIMAGSAVGEGAHMHRLGRAERERMGTVFLGFFMKMGFSNYSYPQFHRNVKLPDCVVGESGLYS